MRKELGAVLKLVQYEHAVDSYGYGCEVIPREARCRKCYFGMRNWHPKEAPTVRLNLLDEVLVVPLIGIPVVHEALYDALSPFWSDVLATRCATAPGAELKIGEKYWSFSLPPKHVVQVFYPAGELWQCKVCKRWICSQGPASRDPYGVVDNDDGCAFMSDGSWDLYVNPPLRLPQHVSPDGSVGRDARS